MAKASKMTAEEIQQKWAAHVFPCDVWKKQDQSGKDKEPVLLTGEFTEQKGSWIKVASKGFKLDWVDLSFNGLNEQHIEAAIGHLHPDAGKKPTSTPAPAPAQRAPRRRKEKEEPAPEGNAEAPPEDNQGNADEAPNSDNGNEGATAPAEDGNSAAGEGLPSSNPGTTEKTG